MLTITKKKFEEYEQFLWEKDNGRLFVLDGLRFILMTNDLNPVASRKYVLENYRMFIVERII